MPMWLLMLVLVLGLLTLGLNLVLHHQNLVMIHHKALAMSHQTGLVMMHQKYLAMTCKGDIAMIRKEGLVLIYKKGLAMIYKEDLFMMQVEHQEATCSECPIMMHLGLLVMTQHPELRLGHKGKLHLQTIWHMDLQHQPVLEVGMKHQLEGAAGPHGQVAPGNKMPYRSATPPTPPGSGYEAPGRVANPVRRRALRLPPAVNIS